MTVTTIALTKLENDLNTMIQSGQILDAFEKYYAEDIVMQDQGFEPWVGKDLNREREKDFVNNITEFRQGELVHSAVGDGVTMSVWQFDYTHTEWGVVKYEQVSVRHWENGLITNERFYRG